MPIIKYTISLCLLGLLASCSNTKKIAKSNVANPISSLKLIGQYVVPHNFQFKNTTVGGLSGIDYDPSSGLYYMVSDDRSAINPARFYTAHIAFTQNGIDTVQFAAVQEMLQANGKPYPNKKQDPYHTPDPEAMRYNAATHRLIWSSEGERIVNKIDTILENPAVTEINLNGKYIDTFSLPHNLLMQPIENGPRQNSVLEGLTFADNYKTLFVSVEEPLYEDGPRSDVHTGGISRIMKFDIASKKNTAQYAYPLDPVAHEAIPTDAFKINGIPDILYLSNNKLLVIERSFSTGRLACTIKVFLANMENATDIKNIFSLQQDKNFVPMSKKLLLNMDNLGIYIDNIEGVTFGPVLPNGHKTLLFIADNNFSPVEKTQFLLFEVM